MSIKFITLGPNQTKRNSLSTPPPRVLNSIIRKYHHPHFTSIHRFNTILSQSRTRAHPTRSVDAHSTNHIALFTSHTPNLLVKQEKPASSLTTHCFCVIRLRKINFTPDRRLRWSPPFSLTAAGVSFLV